MLYILPKEGFELTTSVVIGNDCNGCKSHYHTITASKVLTFQVKNYFLQNTSIIQLLCTCAQ